MTGFFGDPKLFCQLCTFHSGATTSRHGSVCESEHGLTSYGKVVYHVTLKLGQNVP